jgi:hypothetical protein
MLNEAFLKPKNFIMKLFLLLLTATFCLNTHAQIAKGSTLLGGSLNFNYEDFNKTTIVGVSTQFAKAYKDNNFRGLQLSYWHAKQNNTIFNSYFGGIFFRKYIPIVNQFYFFGQAACNVGYSKRNDFLVIPNPTATYGTTENYNLLISFSPGLSYAINKKLHLEIALSDLANLHFTHEVAKRTTNNITNTFKSNSIGLSSSTQLNSLSGIQFGFRFLLQKNKS